MDASWIVYNLHLNEKFDDFSASFDATFNSRIHKFSMNSIKEQLTLECNILLVSMHTQKTISENLDYL